MKRQKHGLESYGVNMDLVKAFGTVNRGALLPKETRCQREMVHPPLYRAHDARAPGPSIESADEQNEILLLRTISLMPRAPKGRLERSTVFPVPAIHGQRKSPRQDGHFLGGA